MDRVRPAEAPTGGDEFSRVAVVIPALNEEEALPRVLADLPPVGLVVVVDNGSTDRTADVARAGGAVVVGEPERGYGAACLAGLALIAGRAEAGVFDPAVVVFVDGDHADHADRLGDVAGPVLRGEADLVIGSRTLGTREPGAMPPQAVWGNRLACFLMRVLFGARHTDLGPFRAISVAALDRLGMADRDFGWTVEMQIKAARARLRVVEVPVPYRRRVGVSKISGTVGGTIRAGVKILTVIGRHGFVRWTPREPAERDAVRDESRGCESVEV
ncbi:MAG: glycosyltransferase family 2 protein [Planctomycetota bacterium]